MLSLLCPAALAEYDKCERPNGGWAGFDQGNGAARAYSVMYSNNHVYVGGYAMGNLSFGSSQANGNYHDHLGTKTGADAHDTPADVTVHHATGSVAADGGSRNLDPASSQLGSDAVIYKMDSTTGKPISVYGIDVWPSDMMLNGTGVHGSYGPRHALYGLSNFDLAGETGMVAATGYLRGRMTFPGSTPLEVNQPKSTYGGWVAKIDMDNDQVKWATNEGLSKDGAYYYGRAVTTTVAGHVIASVSTYARDGTKRIYGGMLAKYDGATGALVWKHEDASFRGYTGRRVGSKVSAAGGENVIVAGLFKGKDVTTAFPGKSLTSCKDGEDDSSLIASMDVSGAAPVTNWAVTVCGTGAEASFVEGDYVYVTGDLDGTDSANTIFEHADSSTAAKCTMTGALGGFLVKLQKSDGKCVWAKDQAVVRGVVADATSVWTMDYDDDNFKFDESGNHTVTPSNDDVIMGKFSASDGTGHWGAAMGGAGDEPGYDMAMTPLGPVVAGYSKSETVTMGDVTAENLQHKAKEAEAGEADLANNGHDAMFVFQLSSTDKTPSCIDQCPSGSLLDATIKAGNCYADDVCIANGAFSPSRPCFRCDSATKPKDLTGPITDNHCFFDGKCVSKGTMAPAYSGYNSASVCETCNPSKDPNQWSVMDGWWHDRSFVKGDDASDCQWTTTGRGGYNEQTGPCAPNSYGILFTRNTAGCQMMPDVPIANQAVTALATNIAPGTELARITSAIGALKGDATSSAETAAAWYQGKAGCEEPKLDHDKVAKTPDISTGACVNTPAAHADAMGLKFGTNMHYGHSIARIKTQQALALLYNDLDKRTVTATQTDIEKDIVAHMLVPLYQGAIEAAHRMDTAGTAAAGLADGAAYWGVIKTQVKNFDAGDRARLTALFEAKTPNDTGFNYCAARALLMRNLPDGSMLQYGQKDHVVLGSHPSTGVNPTFHADAVTANTQHASTGLRTADMGNGAGNPLGQLVDAVEAVHLQARDIGELTDAPTCTMPPPTPPPPSPPTSPAKSDPESASSTLSEGEVAGIAVGAAVGGIVVLVAVGLILRTLLARDAKPMFTCLEKAPAEKNAPAVDKSAPAVDKNAPVDTNI